MHRGRLPARGDRVARQPVSGRENSAEVIGRMTPLGGKPRIVEIEPPDHRANVECRLDRIELELRAGYLRSVRDDRTRDDRSEQLGARRIRQRLEPAAQGVDEAVARRLVRFLALHAVMRDIVGDIDQHTVRLGAHIGDRGGHAHSLVLGFGLAPAVSFAAGGGSCSGARPMLYPAMRQRPSSRVRRRVSSAGGALLNCVRYSAVT